MNGGCPPPDDPLDTPVHDAPQSADETFSDDPRRVLATKLTTLTRQLVSRFSQRAEKAGVTWAKWSLIATVATNPGATQRIISSKLMLSEVTAGRLIDRLCAEGYLERRENPDDRRSYRVYLTGSARPLLDTLGELGSACAAEAFAGLDEETLEGFAKILDAISRNLEGVRTR